MDWNKNCQKLSSLLFKWELDGFDLQNHHAFYQARLSDAVLKVMWKMVCVNSFQVGPGFGEQGCISPWRFPRTTLLLHLRESPPPPCIPTFQKISFLSFCQVLPSWSCWDWVIFKPFDCKWRLNCCSDWTCEVHFLPVAWQNFINWIVLLYF